MFTAVWNTDKLMRSSKQDASFSQAARRGPAGDRLRKRFSINRVCVVADRGMISAETIAELEARKLLYILGVRERSDKLVRKLVLDHPAPFVPFFLTKRKKEIDYVAKAVMLAGGATSSAATRPDQKGRRRQGRDPGRARTGVEEGRQGAGRQQRLLPVPDEARRQPFRHRPRQGADEDLKFDGVFVLRTRAVAARSDARLQAKQGDFKN